MQPDQPQPSIPEADFTPTQFGNSLPKSSLLTKQNKLPNPASDENEYELIPCPYDSRISYDRIWGTNVPLMDYDIYIRELVFQFFLEKQIILNHLYQKQFLHRRSLVTVF